MTTTTRGTEAGERDVPVVYEYASANLVIEECETGTACGDPPRGGGADAGGRRAPGRRGATVPKAPATVWVASLAKEPPGEPAGKPPGKRPGKASGNSGKRSRRRFTKVSALRRAERTGDGAPPKRSRVRGALWAVPAVVAVALAVLLALVWRENGSLSDEADQRRELSGAAGRVAATFFNWDHQHMDQSFAAKYRLLTPAAADAIKPTAGTLTEYFRTNKVSSKAVVNGVYPGEAKRGGATVVVVINTKVTTATTIQSNTGATLALNMKRVGGRWLAENITLLASGVESTTDQNGKPLAKGKGSGTGAGTGTLPGTVPSSKP
ncbi:hypothetical protein [Actinomadura fibrosa]|uniref:Mce-associated membrane protein n=1 Tax=Actinomadura fibrosa TaxID=111802 RepID=A0ABW2XWX9_9ACTN|nr:hypothetical protein [Actinomadura fibrosa]